MSKERDQLTSDDPRDWAELQRRRRPGTGATGYDRLPGEQALPPLRDNSPAEETVPEPEVFDLDGSS